MIKNIRDAVKYMEKKSINPDKDGNISIPILQYQIYGYRIFDTKKGFVIKPINRRTNYK